MVIRNLFLLCAFSLLVSTFQARAVTQITASVSHNPVTVNESVEFTLSANDNITNNAFDFSVLEKDFRVLGTSISSQTRMVNTTTTRITSFTTRLIPKNTGSFVIPSFEYQGVKSQPIQLNVVQAANAAANQARDIFIESELSQSEVWLQQQVTYTVKLHISNQIQMTSGSLTEPKIEGALVEQQGKDRETDKILNGIRYRLIERSYKITPQRSGDFVIESPLFQAEVADGRRSQYFVNRTKTITRTGDSTQLTVKAIPNDYTGHWLPSEIVMLNDEIQPNQTEFKLGEPITRTLTLTALDVSAEQLPELLTNYPASLKVYPDQADTHSSERDNQIISQRIESAAIVPMQMGEVELPEIKINWWNTKTEKMETTRIPARTITVIANPELQQQSALTNQVPANSPTNTSPAQPSSQVETQIEYVKKPWHLNYLALCFLVLWLATSLTWMVTSVVKRKKAAPSPEDDQTTRSNNEKLAFSRLLKACKKSDRQAIQQHLPIWVQAFSQDLSVTNMHQAIVKLANNQVEQEIAAMQAAKFAAQGQDWQAGKLSQVLTQLRQENLTSSSNTNQLAKLNP